MELLNIRMKNLVLITVLFCFTLFANSCQEEDPFVGEESKELSNGNGADSENEEETENEDQPEIPDWTELTHSKGVDPNYSIVFNQNEVLRFDIKISSDDWTIMQDNLSNNLGSSSGGPGGGRPGGPDGMSEFDPVWVPCSFHFNDIEWYKVGIRYKGNSSLSSTYQMGLSKFSFKVDFDQFEDDFPIIKNQRFYGFKQLNLKNNFDDNSFMRDKVASDLFREFGLVSPQTAFCEVYVDFGSGTQYFGLYALIEEVDDTVLESQFGSEDGNLYKPDGDAASFASGSFNESEMEKKNNEEEADYSDVSALYAILNSAERITNLEQWKLSLEKTLDVDVFLKWLAANIVMQNWDTYGRMTHNYYLYNDLADGKLNWIPWDNNEALQFGKRDGALSLSLAEVTDDWPLIKYLVEVPEYRQQYEDYLQEFIEGVFAPERMGSLYEQYSVLIKEYAYAEVSGYSFINQDSDFDQAVVQLKNHVQTRTDEVLSYLAQ